MGKQKQKPKPRPHVVAFDLTDEEHRRLRMAAASHNLPMAHYARAAVLRQIALVPFHDERDQQHKEGGK